MTAGAPLLAGAELGGTKCICILARGPGEILAEERIATTSAAETMPAIEAVLDRWRADHDIAAIGLASFGPLELDRDAPGFGHVTATTKSGWSGADVFPRIAARYGLPTAIDTDVVGAALSEGRWGAARGLASWVYVTVGTGIGAGIIVDGAARRGIGNAEAGHMRVSRTPGDDWPGACGFHGDCVEGLASGLAIERRAGAPAATLAPDHPVWAGVVHALTGMVHNLVMTVAPQRIIVGGGVVSRQPQLLPMVRTRLVESLAGFGVADRIATAIDDYLVAPALGDRAGPLGAIAIAHDALATHTLAAAR